MFYISLLHEPRPVELDALRLEPQDQCSVVESGAGSGAHAKLSSNSSHQVTAIHLAGSADAIECMFPITGSDGMHLLSPANSVDCVSSSATGFASILRVLLRTARDVDVPQPGTSRAMSRRRRGDILLACTLPIGHATLREGVAEMLFTFSAFAVHVLQIHGAAAPRKTQACAG